jgi:aldehyde dehydrogenase (NAD+)
MTTPSSDNAKAIASSLNRKLLPMDLRLDASYGAFIDNRFELGRDPQQFQAVNPATGEVLAKIRRCGADVVDTAVAAAEKAFPAWSQTPIEQRARLLNKLADAIEDDLERLAHIDASDIGRRVGEIRLDHMLAIGQYRYYASALMSLEGFSRPIPGGWHLTKREPYGVCGQIIPWNVPAIMTSFKIAPALAAGNTVVLKPDEHASLSTLELCKIITKIFPPGVVNVVPGMGEEAGAALTAHPKVAKIAFTGSSEVGRIIGQAGASRLVPVSLELGGKSPNIVFPDVDNLDGVIDNASFAAMFCNGQSCLAGTRLFVHEDIYKSFMDRMLERMSQLKVGSPLEEDTALGCLVSPRHGERVLKYIAVGKEEGAKLMLGGNRRALKGQEHGYFVEPTVFEVKNKMRLAQEEIFGPVLSVIKWNDYETMIAEANDVRYGLAAGIYTSNLKNALATADRLQAGNVWVNQYVNMHDGVPFGGYKESGIGREMGKEALYMYTQQKSVTLALDVPPPWFLPTSKH